MTPAAPGTAPGGGAQEAATSVTADDMAQALEYDYAYRPRPGNWTRVHNDQLTRLLTPLAADRDHLSRQLHVAREELATCRERNAAIAVQLDQYRDERDAARAKLAREDGDFDARLAVLDSVIAERDRCRATLERIRDRRGHPGGDWAIAIARAALEARDE